MSTELQQSGSNVGPTISPEALGFAKSPRTWGASYAAAFVAAQGQYGTVVKNQTALIRSDNANYSYQYATLAAYHAAARKALSDNQLGFSQDIWVEREFEIDEKNRKYVSGVTVYVQTIIMHASGEFKESRTLDHWLPGARITEVGSCSSYLKRYQLIAMLGITSDNEDNDEELPPGEQASAQDEFDQRQPPGQMWPTASRSSAPQSGTPGGAGRRTTKKAAGGAAPEAKTTAQSDTLNESQKTTLRAAIDRAGVSDREFGQKFSVDVPESLKFAQLNDALSWLRKL